jgi:general secretion pathway protein N
MRLRLRWFREMFFIVVLLFSLVALLPLRVALDWLGFAEKGLTARDVEGSVWLGALAEARFGTIDVGTVATRLRFLPLLVGRARLDLEQEDDGLRAGLILSRHGFGIDDATGSVAAPALANLPPPALDLSDLGFRFADGLCVEAGGLVKARFAGEVAGMALAATFSGEPRCEGQALLLPLTNQAGTDRLDVRIFADGRYQLDAAMRLGDLPYSGRSEGRF